MTSIKRVAELGGVSTSTVSRYLSGKLAVKPETEAAILSAIEAVGYQPDHVARALREGTTRAIGVVIPNVHNPLFSEIIRGIMDILDDSPYFYFLLPSEDSLKIEQALCQVLVQRRFDAAIFSSRTHDGDPQEQHVRDLVSAGVRVAFINRAFGTSQVPEAFSDHQTGTYVATSRLLAQGRRRVGLLLGYGEPHIDGIVRLQGYRQALVENGLPLDDSLVVDGKFDFDEAGAKTPLLLSKGADALLCANDIMASAALQCVIGRGLRVPDDVAVVGYGDTLISRMAIPSLSSVAQNSRDMGRWAATAVLMLIKGLDPEPLHECFPELLQERTSSLRSAGGPSSASLCPAHGGTLEEEQAQSSHLQGSAGRRRR